MLDPDAAFAIAWDELPDPIVAEMGDLAGEPQATSWDRRHRGA